MNHAVCNVCKVTMLLSYTLSTADGQLFSKNGLRKDGGLAVLTKGQFKLL